MSMRMRRKRNFDERMADEESLQELYEKISKSIHNLPLSVIQANKEGKNS